MGILAYNQKGTLMRRILTMLIGSALLVLALAAPAMADYPPSTNSDSVLGKTVTVSPPGVGGTAFTGSDLTAPLALAGILLVVGLSLLYLGRRRAAAGDR